MANTHETLTELFTDIAGVIRSKTGGTGAIVADQFPDAIAAIDTQENLDSELSTQDSLIAQISTALVGKAGVELPVLSNPAGAANIEAGYQAIDGAGGLIEGAGNFATCITGTFKQTGATMTNAVASGGLDYAFFNGEKVKYMDFILLPNENVCIYVGDKYVRYLEIDGKSMYIGVNQECQGTLWRLGGA